MHLRLFFKKFGQGDGLQKHLQKEHMLILKKDLITRYVNGKIRGARKKFLLSTKKQIIIILIPITVPSIFMV